MNAPSLSSTGKRFIAAQPDALGGKAMKAATIAHEPGSAMDAGGASAKATHPSAWAVRLRAAIDGDERGYPNLLDDIGRLARKVARNQVARWNYGDAVVEDIVQETLIAVHFKRESWDCARPVEPWAATLARNKAIEAMRRARIGREAKLEDLEEDVVAPLDAAPEARGDIEKLLSGLKPRQKDIVTSVMLREEPVAEVARRLSMTEIAVRVAMHRAVKSMGAVVGASAIITQPRSAASKAELPRGRSRSQRRRQARDGACRDVRTPSETGFKSS